MYVSKIGLDDVYPPVLRCSVLWTNVGMSIGPFETKFDEIKIKITTFLIKENWFENVLYQIVANFLGIIV